MYTTHSFEPKKKLYEINFKFFIDCLRIYLCKKNINKIQWTNYIKKKTHTHSNQHYVKAGLRKQKKISIRKGSNISEAEGKKTISYPFLMKNEIEEEEKRNCHGRNKNYIFNTELKDSKYLFRIKRNLTRINIFYHTANILKL